jgi:hypothetical protein
MNNTSILALFLAAIVGGVAAMYRPMAPFQVPAAEQTETADIFLNGESWMSTANNNNNDYTAFFDSGLDNEYIEADSSITPSRKCGFCMG